MMRAERILDERDLERVWALLPQRVQPGESLDETFFRLAESWAWQADEEIELPMSG
jgi:hypothetical protein